MNTNETIALVIRHADREDIPHGSFGNEIPLNEKGKQNAKKFGEKLTNKIIHKIFTSPVIRCVQTAECIAQGYGRSIEIIETPALGAPGLHIADEKIAGEFFLQYGLNEMYQRLITGKNIPGILNLHDLKNTITHFINENTIPNGTTIFITHDIFIAFYHFSINQKIYTPQNWIDYLTGLTFINGQLYEKQS